MIVRVHLAYRLIPILATIASWFGRAVKIEMLDENRLPLKVVEDDTDIYYVKLHGFSS